MRLCTAFVFLCSLFLQQSIAHLCLISPRQRGDMNISKGGSHTCFRHGFPCGGQPEDFPPPTHLQGGIPIFIKWQQNFNHYTVGYPGYMDIAIAVANDVAKIGRVKGFPDPFRSLAVVADRDEYDQAHQRNFTAVVTLPNMDCNHCVIRARYIAHKPGETTFYQCADVTVKQSTPQQLHENKGRLQLFSNMTSESSISSYPNPITFQPKPFSPRNENEVGDTNLISTLTKINTKTRQEKYSDAQEPRARSYQNNYDVGEQKLIDALHLTSSLENGISDLKDKDSFHTTETEPSLLPGQNSNPRFNAITQRQTDFRSGAHKNIHQNLATHIYADKTEEQTTHEQGHGTNRGKSWPSATTETSFNGQLASSGGSSNMIYGISNNIDSPGGSTLVAVNTVTGIRQDVGHMMFRVDSPFMKETLSRSTRLNSSFDYVTDGVLTLDTARNVAVMPMNRHYNMDAIADTVIEMDTSNGFVTSQYNITNGHNKSLPLKSAFSAAIVEIESSYVTFNIEPDGKGDGKFYFVVGRLYVGGSWELLSKTDETEDTYVNFLWADYDISVKTLYVLLGNENDAYGLSARLYKFSVMPGPPPVQPSPDSYSYVNLDVSKYPFMAFHLHPYHTNLLYAVSPGLHNETYPSYHLVVADVDMGTVEEEMQITPPGIFERFYGGAIIEGISSINNQLIHVLRIAHTQADVIATIDLIKKTTSFSQVTNLRNVHSKYADFTGDRV